MVWLIYYTLDPIYSEELEQHPTQAEGVRVQPGSKNPEHARVLTWRRFFCIIKYLHLEASLCAWL